MQMSKVLSWVALFGALTVQLQGCGGSEDPPTTTTTKMPEPAGGKKVAGDLTLSGLTADQAKLIEPAIKEGLADNIDGVDTDHVEITGYSRRLSERQLDSHSVTVAYTILVPAGVEADDIVKSVAQANPSKVMMDIASIVKADPTMSAALEEAGVDIDDVGLEIAVPTVQLFGTDTTTSTTEKPTDPPTTEKPTEAPTTAEPVNGTNSSRRLEFAFTTNELIA